MAKKKRNRPVSASTVPPAAIPPCTAFWRRPITRLFAAGGIIVFVGYLTLSQADPAGQNWASRLAPFLLIVGYALLGAAFAKLDGPSSSSVVSSASENL